MKTTAIVLAVLALGSLALAGGEPEASRVSVLGKSVEQMTFGPLKWSIPRVGKEICREVLPNGLVIYLYPDHKVPTARVALTFRGGSIHETPAGDQVASLLGSFLELGGTKKLTYEQISEEMEGMAASLSTWVGSETGQVGAHCLSENLTRVLEIVHDTAIEPGFREEKLALVKKQAKEEILRQKDYPGWVVGTLFDFQLFGEHPYGRIARTARIEAITRAEIEERHRLYAVPNRSFLAISGDFDVEKTLALVKTLFGPWERSPRELPPIQKVGESIKKGYYHFEKDIPQTNIRLGHLGTKRICPDEHALRIMNRILGGESFKSRLSTRVRSDEGLAYSAGSFFTAQTVEPGSFACYSQTKNEKAFRTIQIMKETILEMTRNPPTAEELAQAKETVVNSFIHRWTSSSYALLQIMQLEVDGYPADYYEKYVDGIRAVTAEDVRRVAGKYLRPDDLVVVLVGKKADLKDVPREVSLTPVTLPPEYMQ